MRPINKHRLGYANRTLGLRLPNNQRLAGEKIRGQLERIGILRASGHEHFTGSLVIPVWTSKATSARWCTAMQNLSRCGRSFLKKPPNAAAESHR